MRHKSTLLLLAAVLIAAVVAYSLSRQPTSEQLRATSKRILPGFEAGQVETLAIEQAGRRLLVRRQDKGGWRVVEPVELRADRWEVEAILDKLELAERVSYVHPEEGRTLVLAPYGLDEPVRKVVMQEGGPGGREWVLLIGREAGAGDAVFVSVKGQEGVYAVPKDVVQKTAVTLADLRSKTLVPRISPLELTKVSISAEELPPDPAFEAVCEKSDGRWELKAPVHELADGRAAGDLASTLHDHRIGVDDFVADDPTRAAEYGLDQPDLTITLEGGQKRQTIVFSRQGKGEDVRHYALNKGEAAIVRVPESLFAELRRPPSDLKERSLAEFSVDEVREVVVAAPERELVLRKGEAGWQIVGDGGAAADTGVVEQFLRDLKKARIERFLSAEAGGSGPAGLLAERSTLLTLRGEEDLNLAQLAFAKAPEDEDAIYARREPYRTVLSLKKQDYYATLVGGRVAFLQRVLLEEPASEAVEVEVRREGEHSRCAWNEQRSEWELRQPVRGGADRAAVQAILREFAHLRALAFATEKAEELAPFGLEPPQIVVRVTYRAPEGAEQGAAEGEAAPPGRVRVLHVGSRTEEPAEGYYARTDADRRVFVLPAYVVGNFGVRLGSKQVCRATDLTALTFRRGEKSLRFIRDAPTSAWRDEQGDRIDEHRAAALEAATELLGDFAAEGIADYIEKTPALYGFDGPHLVVELEERGARGKKLVVGAETEGGNRYVKGPATGFVHVAGADEVARLAAVLEAPEVSASP
jgi:hypothetical protein